MILAGGGPVIPSFGGSSSSFSCERKNGLFCTHWLTTNWSPLLWPALRQHILLTVIAVAIGFAISTTLALTAYRLGWVERPVIIVTSILYTIPSLALFEILDGVPALGLSRTTAEVALVSYTLLILFRNTLAGLRSAPPEVLDAYRPVPARMSNVEVHIFSGIKHGYMMPSMPKAFDQKTRDFSMARALAILDALRSPAAAMQAAS